MTRLTRCLKGALLAGTAALGLLMPRAATAQAQVRKVELAPFVAYRVGGSLINGLTGEHYGIKEALSYGGVLEVALKAGNRLWVLYSFQDTEIDTLGTEGVPMTLHYLQVGGSRDMTSRGTARPFVAGALGIALADADGTRVEGQTRFALSAALGLKTPPASRVVVRAEARAYLAFVGEGEAAGTCGGGGCAIAFSSGTLFQGEFALGLGFRF